MTVAQRVSISSWSDLKRWVPSKHLSSKILPVGWTLERVGDLVQQVGQRVSVQPSTEYKMLGVRWYGEGVFHRETVRGEQISAAYLTPASPGAFIYNRLFAWKASFAVVPVEHADGFVSNEFPQFQVDVKRLLPEYLYLYFTSTPTLKEVSAASSGSAAVSRNRLRENEFLNFIIPLPPLKVQRAMVKHWRKARAQVALLCAQEERKDHDIELLVADTLGIGLCNSHRLPKAFAIPWERLERWGVSFLARDTISSGSLNGVKYPVLRLGDISTITYGIAKSPGNRPGTNARPYLRVANVQRGQLDLGDVKYINVSEEELAGLRLHYGDLLVCEGNSAELVGRPAIWENQIPDCVHQNHILKVRINQELVAPEYVLEYMHTAPARSHFRARAKFTTNLATINSRDLRELILPVPPLDVQRLLVAEVRAIRSEMARLRTAADQLEKESRIEVGEMMQGRRSVPSL